MSDIAKDLYYVYSSIHSGRSNSFSCVLVNADQARLLEQVNSMLGHLHQAQHTAGLHGRLTKATGPIQRLVESVAEEKERIVKSSDKVEFESKYDKVLAWNRVYREKEIRALLRGRKIRQPPLKAVKVAAV